MNLLVLVVDDEPDVEALFRQQFRREMRAGRFVMDFASSGAQALRRVQEADEESLILLLSDINMPGMTGLELLPHVKAMLPELPVIMITAYGDGTTLRRAKEAGADGVFGKPIDFAALKAEIDQRLIARGLPGVTAKILVVDDEPDVEALIVQKFRREMREGALTFSFARDGVEALAAITAAADVDVVVTDINMPRMDGLTLLQKLSEAEHGPATLIVSAYGDMANIRTAMNRGAFDFVTKPIDFADFEITLKKTLRHIATLREARQRVATAERAHAALSRYFSPNLAERLAADASAIQLGGQRRDIASMFTDITGFTSLAESLDSETLARLLNDYLSGMIETVFAHEGTVAKIVGDAMHVLFGAPGDQPDHAARAVACARDLDALAEALRARWIGQGVALGATRIGVHAGGAIVGNFGAARFFDYTAYGDTVNTAARLEGANKQLGTRLCISGAVAERVEGFSGRPIGDLLLRGRSLCLRAFEPVDSSPAADAYNAAFAKLEARDAAALPAFASLVGAYPRDPLANFHLRRLLNGQTGAVIELD